MSETSAPRAASPLEMIEGLTACAHELGKVAADVAKRMAPHDTRGFLVASTEFRHCFFSVRMGIRLASQLRAGQAFAGLRTQPTERPERLDSIERPEREPSAAPQNERERERDYEPVSLPQFLKTLGLVAKAAERRGDELPAHIRDTTLPKLKGLLAEATSQEPHAKPTAAMAVLNRPPAPPPAKSRHLGSISTPRPPLRRDSS